MTALDNAIRVLEIRGESVHSDSVGAEICPQRDKCQSQI